MIRIVDDNQIFVQAVLLLLPITSNCLMVASWRNHGGRRSISPQSSFPLNIVFVEIQIILIIPPHSTCSSLN